MRGGYEVFLMVEIAKAYGLIDYYCDNETAWREATKLYDDYTVSSFNRVDIDTADGIDQFLNTRKQLEG